MQVGQMLKQVQHDEMESQGFLARRGVVRLCRCGYG